MRQFKNIFLYACFGVTALGAVQPLPGQEAGTLVLDLKNYTSSAKLPKQVGTQLEHAGLQWGMVNRTLLVPLVNQKFVNIDTLSLTRFGERKELEMTPGDYAITCVAHELNSDSTNVDKFLSKNAFFNINVLKFTVARGKTTTIEVSPAYKPESTWFRLSKVTMYIPEITVRVLVDGTPAGEPVVINRRTDKSVAWDDYKGPLKF